jgi:hypothetical protein
MSQPRGVTAVAPADPHLEMAEEKQWQALVAATPRSLVIRSLRRRLWRALLDEDASWAFACYTATRTDWCAWIHAERHWYLSGEEQKEQQRQLAQERRQPPWNFGRRPSNSATHSVTPVQTLQSMLTSIPRHDDAEEDSDDSEEECDDDYHPTGLLQRFMNPTDLFVPDDYHHPHDSYYQEETTEATDHSMLGGLQRLPRGQTARSAALARVCLAFATTHLSCSTQSATTNTTSPRHNRRSYSTTARTHQTTTATAANLAADATNITATTPLHEAVRLGHADLVRSMLSQATIDCIDARNGLGQSILHCAAGGLTALEHQQAERRSARTNPMATSTANTADSDATRSPTVGIRAPTPANLHGADHSTPFTDHAQSKRVVGSAAVRAIGRWLKREPQSSSTTTKSTAREPHLPVLTSVDWTNSPHAMDHPMNILTTAPRQRDELEAARLETVTSILAWRRNAVGSDNLESLGTLPDSTAAITAEGGVSINAVDHVMGRTALHYAAELGRTAICEAILQSYYGTMLTVVDCTGRTPCELAGAGGFDHLASYLEARALLYVDPYGTDEDLLAAMSIRNESASTAGPTSSIVPPFGWFETLSWKDVQQRRERRVSQTKDKIREIAARLRIRHHARKTIFEHTQKPSLMEPMADKPSMPSADATCGTVTDEELDDGSDQDVIFDASTFNPIGPDSGTVDVPEDENYAKFEQMVHESHVEVYLTFHSWNVAKALECFSANPFSAFESAGITLPSQEMLRVQSAMTSNTCLICFHEFDSNSPAWKQISGCSHSFCSDCLGDYVMDCSKSNSGLVVSCPHHECKSLLSPSELLDLCPSEDVYSKLVSSANDNYVVSSTDLRFCPHPGCGQRGAIKLTVPDYLKSPKLARSGLLEIVGAVCTNVHNEEIATESVSTILTYESVADASYYHLTDLIQPPRAHRFCFQCGDSQIHWPVTCERLGEWKATIAEQVKDVNDIAGDGEANESSSFNDVAQKLWMKANTRPCPKVCFLVVRSTKSCVLFLYFC